jgi:DNA-binding transcriptional LysR family regulator
MSQIQFSALDLNLFRVLLALLERRSVSLAAEDLSLTPSAVSHALNRLRDAFDDPLFERRGGQLVPTPYAAEVGRRARPAVDALRDAVAKTAFDPRQSEREFIIAAGAYGTQVILPPLIARLGEAAPNVRLRVRRVEGAYLDDLERGRADLAFAAPPARAKRLAWRPLITDTLIWAAREGHPFLRDPLTAEALRRALHVVADKFGHRLSENDTLRGYASELSEITNAYGAAGWSERMSGNVAAIVPDIGDALDIVRHTDCVTLSLRRFAGAAGGLQLLAPLKQAPEITIAAVFSDAKLSDPGFTWLLDQINVGTPATSAAKRRKA